MPRAQILSVRAGPLVGIKKLAAVHRADASLRRVDMTEAINFLQWPAMTVRVIASWPVASSQDRRRHLGFSVFLLSNLL